MTIPASELVDVLPGVLTAGGAALALSGLILTTDTAVPIGSVYSFSDPDGVSDFFGPSADETALASVYFAGYDNSTQKPGNLLFSQYPTAPVAAYLRSGSFAGVTLAQLNAITPGTMSVTMDGVVKTSASIDLSAASSFSNAATIIEAAFTAGPDVTYDSVRQAFVFTSTTTGAASTMTFGTGAIADDLKTQAAQGAVLSQGAIAGVPATAMDAIKAVRLDWASFMTTFEPLVADKLAFATWNSQQNNRFAYVVWDTDAQALVQGSTTNFGYQAENAGVSGTIPITGSAVAAAAAGVVLATELRKQAAFEMGYAASLDFDATNGRATLAYRSQAGLVPLITNATDADVAKSYGYNFYGAYATSAQGFQFMQPGSALGAFAWADSYYNQIWMNARFQQDLMVFLQNSGSVPYNAFGYSSLESALADAINAALNFGAIRAGVTLSASQIVAVNTAAGKQIATVIATRGWYLNITDPGAAVRVARGSPNMTFYYADGGSIQSLELASINIQ